MSDLLQHAAAEGYAVPSFCVWNAETMVAVLQSAEKLRAPVIMMSGPGEFVCLKPDDMGTVAKTVARRFEVRAALHLDHGNSLEMVEACLAAGFTSVMLDYSTRPFQENAEAMRRVVAMARPLNVTVEGELGVIGQVDQVSVEGAGASTLTDPEVAASFVKRTGIDALAVSVGNAHGMYTSLPHLDFDRLAKIHAAVPVPLVLHGGSGTPGGDLQRATSLGIAKVNVASELIYAIRQSLLDQWEACENLWVPLAQAVSIKALAPVLEKWLHLTGAAGRG
jgi:tagatose 1,6-diphosphate aldolase GatY/KbaY